MKEYVGGGDAIFDRWRREEFVAGVGVSRDRWVNS